MSYDYLTGEIDRAFRVLGREGYYQNLTDISAWLKEGWIDSTMAERLRAYNKAKRSE